MILQPLQSERTTDTEAPFLDFLYVANGFVSSKIYDKRDDFDFDTVNFPFLDGDVSRRASNGVYISQLIRVCNYVTDFNARNKCLTTKLLQQGYRYHKLRKTFSKFYLRLYELISKYNVGLFLFLNCFLVTPINQFLIILGRCTLYTPVCLQDEPTCMRIEHV